MKNARVNVCLVTALLLTLSCVPSVSRRERDRPEQTFDGAAARDTFQVCVVEGHSLRLIRAVHGPGAGDTLVGGRPFSERYPAHAPPYAQGATWFQHHTPIRLGGWLYEASTPGRFIAPELLRPLNVSHFETPLFAAADDTLPAIIYIPVRPGCIFHSYLGIRLGPAVDTLADTLRTTSP
jgi:hypothetical protein